MAEIREKIENIEEQLDSLKRLYHGTISKEEGAPDLAIFVKTSKKGSDARFMYLDNMTEADGLWCLNNLEKSYYSKDNVKTVDEEVRKSVSTKAFALYGVESLLKRVQDYLPPIANNSLTIIKPYKFNCHGKDCFFKPHKDAHTDESLVGTLILIPSSKFEGGDLAFPLQGSVIELSTKANSGLLQFVYFDVQYLHEVTLVKSGYRFSVVFNVYSSRKYIDKELATFRIESEKISDETIKSFARDIFGIFQQEKNVLYYDVFDPRLAYELRELFPGSIDVYFGKPDPDVVYDSFEGSEDYYSEGDEYGEADFEDCVDDATSYTVNHIIGKSSKLESEEVTKSYGGNSPCSYLCRATYYHGILLNPSNPDEGPNDEL